MVFPALPTFSLKLLLVTYQQSPELKLLAEFRVHFQSTYIVETCNNLGCLKKLINATQIKELTSETFIYNSAINHKPNASVEA